MKKMVSVGLLVVLYVAPLYSQRLLFRSGIFLHHSTGGCIWGPNGSATSIPNEIKAYNSAHAFSGDQAIAMTAEGWPTTPWNNEWERWHRIFENQDTVNADIRPYLAKHRIIVIKSCFPSSSISGQGAPSDTLQPTKKTIYNYKWHWRSFIRVMRRHPNNFFAIWTNAPLVASQTNNQEARLSDKFCRWAKDTLACGLDPKFGAFPRNVYVFDFFHKLAGSDGKLMPSYAQSSGDSHPNSAATALVAPQFVKEIFDAAIAYEKTLTAIRVPNDIPAGFSLIRNYPNPFSTTTHFHFSITEYQVVTLTIFDMLGQQVATLVNEKIPPGSYTVKWESTSLPSGTYFYRFQTGESVRTSKLLLVR